MNVCFFGATGKIGTRLVPLVQSLFPDFWIVSRQEKLGLSHKNIFFYDIKSVWTKEFINFLNYFEALIFFMKTNSDAEILKNLDLLNNSPQKKIIYASSVRIFGNSVGFVNESSEPRPFWDDFYAHDKIAAEILLEHVSMQKRWECHTIRLGELAQLEDSTNLAAKKALLFLLGNGYLHYLDEVYLQRLIKDILLSQIKAGFFKHLCTSNHLIKDSFNTNYLSLPLSPFLVHVLTSFTSFRTRCLACFFSSEGTQTHQISPH